MRYDPCSQKSARKSLRLLLVPVFLSVGTILFPQSREQDSINKIPRVIITKITHDLRLSVPKNTSGNSFSLIPPSDNDKTRTLVLLDSLKNKSSRTLVTRKLYELVIVERQKVENKTITGGSDKNYLGHSGKKIRKIEIRRLEVFGSDINNPETYSQSKITALLNRTHISTNENIIRKNLIFSAGDTVSPLKLSDNERIIRQLPFIDDARILILPIGNDEVDILVLTKDIFSLGAAMDLNGVKKGSVSLFEKNIFGMGHEFGIGMPWDAEFRDSPGFGVNYIINNIRKSFINLNLYYIDGLGKKTFGFDLERRLVSSTTKWAGGLSVREMFTSEDLDTLPLPEPLKYNLQDYWVSRSFLINTSSVSRIIIGARYTNNNVFDHPVILEDSFHYLQKYKMFLGSLSFSVQKYYKTNLIYGYGRTEDIPHGMLMNLTLGREINEFKKRYYTGLNLSVGESVERLGYFFSSAGFSTFINKKQTEQGLFLLRTNYFSNLIFVGRYRVRNFINIDYTRGFDRYIDENLSFIPENGFSGFGNDSIGKEQRLTVNLESVIFSPREYYGFRYAIFGFSDLGFLFGTNEFLGRGNILSAIGLGIRFRNDNLVFKTFQIRLGFFPNLPLYSKKTNLIISGEQLLRPYNFDPGPPSLLPYR